MSPDPLSRRWGLGTRLMVTRPFSLEKGGVWARDYVAVTGVAWSELVNNRGHFWMVRQALHDSTM